MKPLALVPLCAFTDNYIWTLHNDTEAVVVDPGQSAPVIEYLQAKRLKLSTILLTHHHADHIGGVDDLIKQYSPVIYAPHESRIPQATHRVSAGQVVNLPQFAINLTVMEVPAHTRSHIAYYDGERLFCGDTLFAGGCGRLFEGTAQNMFDALSQFATLPEATLVCCAHEYTLANLRFARAAESDNPRIVEWETEAQKRREHNQPTLPTTIGLEKATNPFMRCHLPTVARSAADFSAQPLLDPVSVLGALREWKNQF